MEHSKTNDEINDEANEFAMHLLVPTEFLKRELEKLGSIDLADDTVITKLAKKFKVPITVMAIRLGQVLGK